MEANSLETVHWNFLKFLGNVTVIHLNLPRKHMFKWMYVYRENVKMVVAYGR